MFKQDALGKLILRLTVGILMLFHGVAKLNNPGSIAFIGKQLTAVDLPAYIAHGVYVGEIIAPLMLIFGYRTRLASLITALTMIVAIGLVHRNELLDLGQHGGWALELQAFYLFGSLAITCLGSGRIAIKPD